ncbi:MAG TPA: hypothetical protein VD993_09765 [Chitinophagaceae bacterium]|nr:hypothetical protein [Chitinophagaceae bacterium]
MAISRRSYAYPVKSISEAKVVLQPEFQPDLFDENHLYVVLDEVREQAYLHELYFDLGYIQNTKYFEVSSDYVKIIFSGHRGSGKSAELRRIEKELTHPERYFTIFIDLEQEVEVGSFQYADFFSLLIHKLIEKLTTLQNKGGYERLQKLAEKLMPGKTEKIVIDKDKSVSNLEAGAEAGFRLFGFGGKASFKEVFSGENETSVTIRKEIKQNTLSLINNFNAELVDIRIALEDAGFGRDILFIFDGSEKIRHEVYEDLFVKNGNIVSEINLNMVIAVPIIAHFQIEKAPYKFTNRYIVPMIKLENNNKARELMQRIIGKRVDTSIFIDEEALDLCIDFSGGCIRQLFHVVYESLKKSLGQKINRKHVEAAVSTLGKYLWEYLREDHFKALKDSDYRPADDNIGELLYMLILLKYNGRTEINPLLKNYPDFKKWMEK